MILLLIGLVASFIVVRHLLKNRSKDKVINKINDTKTEQEVVLLKKSLKAEQTKLEQMEEELND